jgi:hypothetical protein
MSNTRKAKPEATKVVTDFDLLIAEAKFEPYKFTMGGKARELPHIRTLPVSQLEGLDADFDATFPDVAGDEELVGLLADLPMHAYEAFVESWFAHSGLELGELLASVR